MRVRVIDDIIKMLNRVGEGRARDDAVLVMAGAYRSYAHHHPGRYSAFTRMPLGGDDPEYAAATRGAAAPVIEVLSSYGLDGEEAFYVLEAPVIRVSALKALEGDAEWSRRLGAPEIESSRRFDLPDQRRVLWWLVPGGLRRLT